MATISGPHGPRTVRCPYPAVSAARCWRPPTGFDGPAHRFVLLFSLPRDTLWWGLSHALCSPPHTPPHPTGQSPPRPATHLTRGRQMVQTPTPQLLLRMVPPRHFFFPFLRSRPLGTYHSPPTTWQTLTVSPARRKDPSPVNPTSPRSNHPQLGVPDPPHAPQRLY